MQLRIKSIFNTQTLSKVLGILGCCFCFSVIVINQITPLGVLMCMLLSVPMLALAYREHLYSMFPIGFITLMSTFVLYQASCQVGFVSCDASQCTYQVDVIPPCSWMGHGQINHHGNVTNFEGRRFALPIEAMDSPSLKIYALDDCQYTCSDLFAYHTIRCSTYLFPKPVERFDVFFFMFVGVLWSCLMVIFSVMVWVTTDPATGPDPHRATREGASLLKGGSEVEMNQQGKNNEQQTEDEEHSQFALE